MFGLLEIGNKYQKSAAQIALRWLIEQEQVVVIPKSATAKHLSVLPHNHSCSD